MSMQVRGRLRHDPAAYDELKLEIPAAGWMALPALWPARAAPQSGDDREENPIVLCSSCHRSVRKAREIMEFTKHSEWWRFCGRPTDTSLHAYKDFILSMTLALNPDAKDEVTEDEWRGAWEEFWACRMEMSGSESFQRPKSPSAGVSQTEFMKNDSFQLLVLALRRYS